MNRFFWLPLLWLVMLLSPGCTKSPRNDLPPDLVWHKDQNRIDPAAGSMNVWEGFRVDRDAFTADRNLARFILWRLQKQKPLIAIEYSLRGGAVDISVNARQKKKLPPAAAFRWIEFNVNLKQGLNFLAFTKKSGDQLRIRAIRIDGPREKPESHLAAGQGFSRFLPPGRGRLELSGSGTVEISLRQGTEKGLAGERHTRRSGFLTRRIACDIEFSRPGLLSVRVQKGRFAISGYSYAPRVERPAEAKIAFQGKPAIYFVLADACQAQHLGTYGYFRATSPNIDAFAREALVYENAYANAVFTRSSVATILTGLLPERHSAHMLRSVLSPKFLTLPEFLKSRDYATHMVSANIVNSPRAGFAQGIDRFTVVTKRTTPTPETGIADEFVRWLDTAPAPHFCFLHFVHPHLPFSPPDDFPVTFRPGKEKVTLERMNQLKRQKRLAGLPRSAEELQELIDGYDASIAWVDHEFGRILKRLREKGLYEDSLIVFLADHGEAMNEHGVVGHVGNVFDETARVPLIIKYPRGMGLRGRVRRIVELADLFPTIAARFGQSLALDGSDLLRGGISAGMDDRIAVSRSGGEAPRYGLRWRQWHYLVDLRDNRERLFDLAADPGRDLGAARPEMREFLRARFLEWLSGFRNGTEAETTLQTLSADEIEELKTLGYL